MTSRQPAEVATAHTVTGMAAGVPFTALPPATPIDGPAPLVVTWHLMDSPCTDVAFAAALPLNGVAAWRVHLGMPWCGARNWDGGREAAGQDPMMEYVDPVVRQAADEFPAALAELRHRFPLDDGPIGIVGGSLGGAVALEVLARQEVAITTAALINPAIRARSVVRIVTELTGRAYPWDERSSAAADRLDFVAHAGRIATRIPPPSVLVISGELDFPGFRKDAADLVAALQQRYPDRGQAELAPVPGLAHPLAAPPGIEPAPQLPTARTVDELITAWSARH